MKLRTRLLLHSDNRPMGIETSWKKILNQEFGFCYEESLPEGTEIEVVIEDFSLNIRRVLIGLESWNELFSRLQNRVRSKTNPKLRRYVMVFDEGAHVPISKQLTQKKRMRTEAKRSVMPFDGDELRTIEIGESCSIPEPKDLFLQRLVITRKLTPDLYSLCSENLARCAIPYDTTLILDGGYTKDLIKKNGDQIRINQCCVDDSSSLDEPHYITINTRDRNEPDCFSQVTIGKSNFPIGEGDLKIPRNISHVNEGNIYIRSNDTDTIPILLLHMRSWINPATGYVRYGIFIDPENMRSQRNEIVDVVSLWRKILVHFRETYPGISAPIETLVMLILLTGSDYTDSFPQLGPKRVWDSFVDGGHRIMFPNSKQQFANREWGSDQTVITQLSYGNPEQKYNVIFAEHRIFDFVRFMYQRFILKNTSTVVDMKVIRRRAYERDSKCKEQSRWNIPQDDEEIYAKIRRVFWTLDYWLNGSKSHCSVEPVALDPVTKKSLYGWELEEGTEREVKRAKIVHRFTNPPPKH